MLREREQEQKVFINTGENRDYTRKAEKAKISLQPTPCNFAYEMLLLMGEAEPKSYSKFNLILPEQNMTPNQMLLSHTKQLIHVLL